MSGQNVLAPGEGRTLDVLGEEVLCKVVGEETDGAWSLFEVTVSPECGPPLHRHGDFDEAYYMLDGELEIRVGDETVAARPGHFVRIPKGAAHTYKNRSSSPARFLAWACPAGVEHFFEALHREVTMPPDPARILAVAARHHVEFVGGGANENAPEYGETKC